MKAANDMGLWLRFALVAVLLAQASCVTFELAAGTKKCLQEDVDKDVLVIGDYSITDDDRVETMLEVMCLEASTAAWLITLRSPIQEGIQCTERKRPSRASLPSRQTTMMCSKSASPVNLKVSLDTYM